MRTRQDVGVFDWLLLAVAVALAAVILYYGAQRWPHQGSVITPEPVAAPPVAAPARGVTAMASSSLASSVPKGPAGASRSFQAVSSIPPLLLSRTGRPSVRTKAPPAPKTSRDK